ncbi:MAG: hypothetical protein AABZ47_06250 [Planctomycetota bacterium]
MVQNNKGLVLGSFLLGLLATQVNAVITMTCIPVSPFIGGNTTVEIECFITSDVNQGLKGVQIDFPCTYPVPMGSTGPLTVANPGGIISRPAGSLGGTPHFSGGANFLAPVSEANCFIGITPFPLAPPFQLPANTTRYVATFTLAVGACAGGEFPIGPDGVTNPPLNTNGTRVRDDAAGQGNLVLIMVVGQQLTIDTGRCCSGSNCLGDLNQHCCQNVQGGLLWDTNASCGDGCPCTSNADCNDANPCTDDSCVNNFCENAANTLSCNDGLFCTSLDFCTDGVCQGANSPCTAGLLCNETLDACVECLVSADCPSDSNPCTDEVCDPNGDCQSVNNTLPCNDGLHCTRTDACNGGVCVGSGVRCTSPSQPICDEALDRCVQCLMDSTCDTDGLLCTTDTCNVAGGNCLPRTNNTNPCEDGMFCTVGDICGGGVCNAGTNTPCEPGETCDESTDTCAECVLDIDCLDDNVCTTDVCVIGQCQHNNNNDPCDDGLFCTDNDGCSNGTCVGSGDPCPGQMCDETSDLCVDCFDSVDCDNGQFCDGVETCIAGICEPGTAPCVTPPNDICDEVNGICVACFFDDDCIDGLFCNGDETCLNGACVKGVRPCPPDQFCNETTNVCEDARPCPGGTNAECNDTNVCTTDTCVAGRCEYANNTLPCNDGLFCTATDVCSGGVCGGTGNPCPANRTCDEPNDRCVQCFVNAECNDNNICTTDTCNATGLCVNANNTVPCNDGLFCTLTDVCGNGSCVGSGNRCPGQQCNETTDTCVDCSANADCNDNNPCTNDVCQSGTCINSPNTVPCNDGLFCTSNDTCSGGVCVGGANPCSSNLTCDETNDRCVECFVNADCQESPDNICTTDTCSAQGLCVHTNNTVTCNDGLFCTLTDRCTGGACVGSGARCSTAQFCLEDQDQCVQCRDANDCEDGNVCSQDVCENGSCVFPPELSGTPCGNPTDGGLCNRPDSCNGAGACQSNIAPEGTSCPNGLFCDGNETCRTGVCADGLDPCRSQQHCVEGTDTCLACIGNTECIDDDPCTTDECISNVCVQTPIPGCVASRDVRGSISKKGSLLIYPNVEIRWTRAVPEPEDNNTAGGPANFVVTQDTFLDLTNDYPREVDVQMYFINGDGPLAPVFAGQPPVLIERAHEGWNWVDCQTTLTADQPTYWALSSGLPIGCQPFNVLDPGTPPGRPDPEGNPGVRVLRGYVVAWAVDRHGREIRWNHLKGDAVIIDYALGTAAEYNAYAFQALTAAHGALSDDEPGQLLLDGIEYDNCFDKVQFDFYASGSLALSNSATNQFVILDTDLTILPVSADLRQDTTGPVTTKAKFDIWNQNETRFSGTERCISCWNQTLLSRYGTPNHFLRSALQTDKGKARIDGLGSTQCPLSADAAILGITLKQLSFTNGQAFTGSAQSAISLVGQGNEDAVLRYDIISGPDELFAGPPLIESSPTLKNGDREPAKR